MEQTKDGIIFSITVIPNFELERELIGFGEGLTVLTPRFFVQRIKKK
ncbi:WYL domain-containing protein [Niabella defluvii]|nr:WYL domain-containing protein [Niabella sp. I65]